MVSTPDNPAAASSDTAHQSVSTERPLVHASVDGESDSEGSAIRPFRVKIAQEKLDELHRRLEDTIWPQQDPIHDPSQGVSQRTMQKVVDYWRSDYNWRRCEDQINALPNYVTRIDGLDIHFIHVRSRHENALPIVLTHGWPGSFIWMVKLVGPLTDPTAYDGTAEDAFDVVIPSMAGFGFSGKPTEPGWDCSRMASAWIQLMRRLEYDYYVAQGGDWGALITEQMAVQAPPGLLGIHTNMPAAVQDDVQTGVHARTPPSDLTVDELYAFEGLVALFGSGLSYAQQMANHPRSLSGIVDSPVGLASWFLDNDLWGLGFIERVFDGQSEGLSRDDLLDNITVTWLTDTALSGARIYRENKLPFFAPKGLSIPVAVSAFPDEIYQCPPTWASKAYSQLVYYGKPPKGGHFAPWEQPAIFAQELRSALGSLRGTPTQERSR